LGLGVGSFGAGFCTTGLVLGVGLRTCGTGGGGVDASSKT